MKPTANNMTATTKWLQPAARWRIPLMIRSSSVPMIPASTPSPVPPPASQSEARAQNSSPVSRKVTSVATTASRNAMGKGTTIGWMGWRAIATAVLVPSGRGCPSFFMSASRAGDSGKARPLVGQPACRAAARGARAACGVALLALFSPLLTGCVQGPLSALDPASGVTRSVATLWWSMAIGTGVVLLFMLGLATLAIRQDPPRAPDRRRVRLLLLAGGIGLPSVVIAVLLSVALRIEQAQWPPGAKDEAATAFHVDVVAHQWWWEARYTGGSVENSNGRGGAVENSHGPLPRSVNVIHVPAGVPVHLRIMATDVIHAFWVPRIAGKLDAVPGRVNRLRILVDEPGEYAGVCAEYCGDGHAGMRFTLVAHEPADMPELLATLAKEAP